MAWDEPTNRGAVTIEPSPEYHLSAPPLPVLMRVPRFTEQLVAESEPAPPPARRSGARGRRGGRLLARLALVALIGVAAAPWLVRWRPWELLTTTGRLPFFTLAAGEAETRPTEDTDSTQPALPPESAPISARVDANTPLPANSTPQAPATSGARLVPDIIPLDNDKGGTP